MPLNVQYATLKIDFKIDEHGILRIIDLGDGFGAGTEGFDENISARLLQHINSITNAPIAPVFGELPCDLMDAEILNIPVILRPSQIEGTLLDGTDLISHPTPFMPFSHYRRAAAYVAYAWGKKIPNCIPTPLSLIATEMHKALWYFLLEQHLSSTIKPELAYWANDCTPSQLDMSKLNHPTGFFIKIVDRSDGGGTHVYYAKDKKQLLNVLSKLHLEYKNDKSSVKHLFLIEPAYTTLKQINGKPYNVTGRAFLSLVYNKDTNVLDMNVAAAKWMIPVSAYNKEALSENQMLSNVQNSIKMINLDDSELSLLNENLRSQYQKPLTLSFLHEDLIRFCAKHPQMDQFKSCLKPNSAYLLFLKFPNEDSTTQKLYLESLVHSFIQRDRIQGFLETIECLKRAETLNPSFFKSPSDQTNLLELISSLLFYEKYINLIKNSQQPWLFFPALLKEEGFIKNKLNQCILKFLAIKNPSYDKTDFNRALRQATFTGDLDVVKVLLYTNRAQLHALSPTKKSALDTLMDNQNEDTKTQCLNFLIGAGLVKEKKEESIATPRPGKLGKFNP